MPKLQVLKKITLNPWSFMLRMRFWPMTARPMRAMSQSGAALLHTVAVLPIRC